MGFANHTEKAWAETYFVQGTKAPNANTGAGNKSECGWAATNRFLILRIFFENGD